MKKLNVKSHVLMRCADIVLVYLSFQSTCFKIETPMALH